MKRIIIFLLVMLFIVSCTPSQAQIEQAIAETQAAMPTETPTLEPTEKLAEYPRNEDECTSEEREKIVKYYEKFISAQNALIKKINEDGTTNENMEKAKEIYDEINAYQPYLCAEEIDQAHKDYANKQYEVLKMIDSNRIKNNEELEEINKDVRAANIKFLFMLPFYYVKEYYPRSSYEIPYAKDFLTYPYKYVGKNVKLENCKVFNIKSTSEFQCWYEDEAVTIKTFEPFDTIYKDDKLTVYGIGAGEACGQNSYGAEICQPLLENAYCDH